MTQDNGKLTRRQMLRKGVHAACVVGLGGTIGVLADRSGSEETVWQLDPTKCAQCSNCATECVLEISAVRCVQLYERCGYCDLCFGYFTKDLVSLGTGAESQLCPTGAIKRKFVEDPYFEYVIDEELCTGCAKCVEPCRKEGNGSLILQVRHDRCLNCNDCSIAAACPTQAFRRVPASQPYIIDEGEATE
jgi:electron transport complex protein RnfB